MALFTDPVAQVVITDPKTKQEWRMTYPESPYLTGGTINYDRAKMTGFTFSIDIPYEKGLEMLKSPSRFQHNNLVKMRFGYPTQGMSGWTPWAGGFIKSDGMNVTVDANGVAGSVTVQGVAESYGYDVDEGKLKAAGWDHLKILELCAEGMGMLLNVSLDTTIALTDYTTMGEGLTKSLLGKSFPSHYLRMSYVEIVKRICKEQDLTFLIAPSGNDELGRTLHVGSEADFIKGELGNTGGASGRSNTYVVRGIVDEKNNQYPALMWAPEGGNMGLWLASAPDPAAHGAQVAGINTETGGLVVEIVKPKELDTPVFGVIAGGDPKDNVAEGIKDDESRSDGSAVTQSSVPIDKGGEARVKKQAQVRQKEGNPTQKGVITALGLPFERPGHLCFLRGAGQIFDGPYMIEAMTQTYAPGSWDISLTVRRDGVVAKSGDQEESAGGQMENK